MAIASIGLIVSSPWAMPATTMRAPWGAALIVRPSTPEEFAATLGYIADGKLDWQPLVTGTIGLEAVSEAFRALEDPEGHAKIVIDPWNGGALRA